ncbi:MAG: hypothetical protein U9Q07_15035, partial [Planctomycetota bacterium]|nr:hypothetical protein [Planctomycetota bacterium]
LHKGLQEQQTGIWRIIMASRITRPVAAAAVILIAVALFRSMPARNADTIEEFYGTVSGVENVCVTSFKPGRTDPFQQVWTSQSLKMRLFKAGSGEKAQFALWDIAKKVQMTMYLSTVQTEPLTAQRLAELEKSMTPSSGLAPFPDVKDVPKRAQWNRVNDPTVLAVIPGCEVYDLIWVQQTATSEKGSYRKWRVFVDAETHLPRRAEFYSKSEPEQEYTFESFVIITYPSESEIQDIVASTFGSPGSRTDGPEYIGTPGISR